MCKADEVRVPTFIFGSGLPKILARVVNPVEHVYMELVHNLKSKAVLEKLLLNYFFRTSEQTAMNLRNDSVRRKYSQLRTPQIF